MSYTYGNYNGKLLKATYGNGDYYENVYDELERIIGIKHNGSLDYEWKYDPLGSVYQHIDNENNVIYNYEYDSIGRLVRQFSKDKNTKKGLLNFQTVYDGLNRVKSQRYTYGDEIASTSYIYQEDNLIDKMTYSTNMQVDLEYDELMRKTDKKLGHPYITQYLSEKYIYWLGEGGPDARSTTLKRIEYENLNSDGTKSKSIISYEYDDIGNITKISEDGVEKVRYYYDELNHLIREDNKYLAIPGHPNFSNGKTIRYVYDAGGNIDYINEYAYTTSTPGTVIDRIEYSYNHPVNKNVLTNYNGQSISVDNIGNPTTYLGYTMTWEKGRRLSTISGNGLDVSYKYDVNGIRTEKRVNGVTTKYYTDGSNIINERRGLNSIWYFYDENGSPIGMKYNSDDYYFQKNAQGDIIRIYDSDANLVGQYVYYTWGKESII